MCEMIRRLFAVAIAALAFAASASAQQYGPTVTAQPAPGPTAMTVPNTPACPVNLPTDGTRQRGAVGNATAHLATATRGFVMQSTGQYWGSNCQTGASCNNGNGSFSSDFGFVFGPTKSFFSPCGPRVLPDCGGNGNGTGCGKCRTPIFGRGPSTPFSHCAYDVFLNH